MSTVEISSIEEGGFGKREEKKKRYPQLCENILQNSPVIVNELYIWLINDEVCWPTDGRSIRQVVVSIVSKKMYDYQTFTILKKSEANELYITSMTLLDGGEWHVT